MSSDWSVNLLQDEPIRDTKLWGLEKTVEALYNFLSSESMITPLAIAINGEWGSGKTSLINTLKNKIDHDKDRITIFFDAWKYEYSDPAAGLFLTITEQLSSKTKSDHLKEIAKNVGSLALDIFSRHYIGISTT
jgi:predicted KAP-like P-loop ATPase